MKTLLRIRLGKGLLPLLFILLSTFHVSAQWGENEKIMIGAGGFYNFQTESKASEIRVKIPIINSLYLTPRFSYYPPGNKINEYYAGADINWHFLTGRKIKPYLLAGGYYNNWINSAEYLGNNRKKNNIAPEAGCGIVFNIGCRLKPYVEYRYDVRWREGSLGAGLFFNFGKCPKNSRHTKCPAYQ